MARLDGKTAIVSGARGGIGRAHALLLAHEGANAVVNENGVRCGADGARVVDATQQPGGNAAVSTVSAEWHGAETIVADAIAHLGSVDILVYNACAGDMNDLWRFTAAQWDKTYYVEPKGYFALIRPATPQMARSGSGCIANTSSGSAFGHPGSIAHASSREAVIGLARAVANGMGRSGIRCNAIRPFAAGVSTSEFAEKGRNGSTRARQTSHHPESPARGTG